MIDKNDPRLTAYVMGELDESELREVAKAIEASHELKAEVEELRETIGLLDAAYKSEAKVCLGDEQRAVLDEACTIANLKQEKSVQVNERRFYRESRFYWTVAIAAAILLMLIPLGVYEGAWFNDAGLAINSKNESTDEIANSRFALEDSEEETKKTSGEQEESNRDKSYGERLAINGIGPFDQDPTSSPQINIGGVPASSLPEETDTSAEVMDSKLEKRLAGARYGFEVQDADEFLNSKYEKMLEMDPSGSSGSHGGDSNGWTTRIWNGGIVETFVHPSFSVDGGGDGQPRVPNLSLLVAEDKSESTGQAGAIVDGDFDLSMSRPTETKNGRADLGLFDDEMGGNAELPPSEQPALVRLAEREWFDSGLPDTEKLSAAEADRIVMNPPPSSPKPTTLDSEPLGDPSVNPQTEDQKGPLGKLRDSLAQSTTLPDGQDRGRQGQVGAQAGAELEIDRSMGMERQLAEHAEGQQGEGQQGEGQQGAGQDDDGREEQSIQRQSETARVDDFYFRGQEREVVQELLKRVDPSGTREIPIQVLPELGTIILRGDPKDVAQVEDLIRQIAREEDESGVQGKRVSPQFPVELGQGIAKHNKEVRRKKPKTWKRVKAIPNTTRLMVGDKDELEMNGMQVNVQVDGFRARVLIDCFYYNHHPRQLEGNFKLRLPDDASLYYFAFGQSVYEYRPEGKLAAEEFLPAGQQFVSLRPSDISRVRQNDWQHVKEARMVPREKAAHAYRQEVRKRVDPALVEWSGAGVFNARVFPLMPNKLHRVVIGYDVNLTQTDGGLAYELDLPESMGECKVNLNVLEMDGVEYKITPDVKPVENMSRVERLNQGKADQIRKLSQQRQQLLGRLGKEHPQVLEIDKQIDAVSDLRNQALEAEGEDRLLESQYHFDNPEAKTIRLTFTNAESLLLRSDDETDGSFWATRITPDLPKITGDANDRAVFLVDTSLSSQPDKFNVWLKLMQATLNNNRGSLNKFAVVFFNVENHFWKNEYSENTEENVQRLVDDCQQLALEGATDLYGAIQKVASADWIKSDNKTPDLFLLSDGAANWGETNLRLLNGLVADSKLGSLFAYQTGLTGTAIGNLRFIAGATGGAVFSVAGEDEIAKVSIAHRQRPWRVTNLIVEGGTDVMTAGRVQWIYPGQTITLVGRVGLDGAEPVDLGKIVLKLKQGNEEKTIEISSERTVQTDLASRLYGQVAVGQLESLGDSVFDVATAYARHFRVTGQTCSLLMLESEADYQRFDIKPEEDLFVIKSKDAGKLIGTTLKNKAAELADPKQQLTSWLARLESMPGVQFKMPTALKLALDDMKIVAISKSLDCSPTIREGLSEDYLQMLSREQLDYKLVKKEADRRLANRDDRGGSPTDEALKVMSSLVERNPGDLVLARDVAFSAMELQRPAQAYHLLRRIVMKRPQESSVYVALGQCLEQVGQADLAMVYYEIAVNSTFQNRSSDYKKIVASEYSHLLREVISGKQESSVKEFAKARLTSLTKKLNIAPCDVVVTMMWNTDQTDIDLHIVEPSGEECFYQHRDTKSGGHLTQDITDGYGPEMYTLPKAPQGEYRLLVKYYAGNQNRTDLRSKVYLTIHHNFGRENASVTRKSIELSEVGGKEPIDTFSVK